MKMPFVDLTFPKMKDDLKLVREYESRLYPDFYQSLQKDGGVKTGLRGLIISRDGQNISDEEREVFVFEWPDQSDYHKYCALPVYAQFRVDMKPALVGPPDMRLLETNKSPANLHGNSVLNVLAIHPKDPVNESEVQAILQKVAEGVAKIGSPSIIYGTSQNLDPKQIVVLETFPNIAACKAVEADPTRRELVGSILQHASIENIMAESLQKLW